MNALFSESSMRILESLSFTDTLYAFDFDGTLAPIVENPEDAKMKESTERLFAKLSAKVPTAIISGRSLKDLRSRVPVPVRYLIANHGLEGLPRATAIDELRTQCGKWREQIEIRLRSLTKDPGVTLEDKEYSLSIHYRKSRRKKAAKDAIVKSFEGLSPDARPIAGKLVFSVVPVGGPHKGMALSRLLQHSGLRFAFYIGDDDTDEDVFGMRDSKIFSVRVGNSRKTEAKYYISKQTDIDKVLKALLSFHGIEE